MREKSRMEDERTVHVFLYLSMGKQDYVSEFW